jgi:hypothetical protein
VIGESMPARPDAPAGAFRPGRRLLPTLIVAGVLVVTAFGGFVAARALPETTARPLTLGGILTTRPLPGWAVARRAPVSLPRFGVAVSGEFAQLTRGAGALDLLAFPDVGGSAEDLAILYRDGVLSHQLERLSVSRDLEPVVLGNGLEGVRFHYIGSTPGTGAAVEGTVTAVVSPSGNGAVFDGWAFQGQLELLAEELAEMVNGAEVA